MFAIGLAVLVWLGVGAFRKRRSKRARRDRRHMLAYAVASALLLLVLASALLPVDGGSYYTRQMLTLAHPLTDRNMTARLDMWGRLAPVILANPWGWGVGSLGSATYRYGEVVGLRVADNQYLEVAVETGLVGLTLFVAILAAACAYSLRLAARGSSLGLAALLACWVVAIAGIAGPPLKAFPANILFGCLLGAMSGEYSRWRRSRRASPLADQGKLTT
jgi:O-antigen ligase